MDDYNLFINTTLRSLRFGRMDNLTTIGASFLENCKGLDSIDLGTLRNASQVVGGSFLSGCKCLKSIDCCCILHNLLVGMRDDIPDGWRDEYCDEISDLDAADSYIDEIDEAVEKEAPRDARRNQFVAYFNEIFF